MNTWRKLMSRTLAKYQELIEQHRSQKWVVEGIRTAELRLELIKDELLMSDVRRKCH